VEEAAKNLRRVAEVRRKQILQEEKKERDEQKRREKAEAEVE